MEKLPPHLQDEFFRILNNEVSMASFETWLYGQEDLEDYIGEELYIPLISINFKDKDALYGIEYIIGDFLNYETLLDRKIRNYLRDIIYRSDNFVPSILALNKLASQGYDFLNNLTEVYGKAFMQEYIYPHLWERLSHYDQKAAINRVFQGAKKEAERILLWLDTGKIKLVNQEEEPYEHYLDFREEEERKLQVFDPEAVRKHKAKTLRSVFYSLMRSLAKLTQKRD